jgi:uncharacterized protein (DUF1697 family)
MASFIALLRAVNVGGTGKLPMADLEAMCEAAGFEAVRTYIASGNVVFRSGLTEKQGKAALEARLQTYAGRQVGVVMRTVAEMIEVLAGNPFPKAPGNRVMAVFLDEPASPAALYGVTGRADDEEVVVARREIYIRCGKGMGTSKLRIPAAKLGTARNMNTVAKLASMANA